MQDEGSEAAKPDMNKKRRFKTMDIVLTIGFLLIIAALLGALLKQLNLKHEVADARATTDKLITAMQKQDGAAARKLGDTSFQAQHSATQLNALFAESKPYTAGTPEVVKQTADNGSANKVVSIYYKFNAKKPFYVRTTAIEPNGTTGWHIINFSGNASLNALTK